jgi:hypothetical protein
MFAYFTGPLMQALSRPHQLAMLEWARTAVGILFLVAAGLIVRGNSLNWQVMGVALARLFSVSLIVAPVFLYLLMRFCGISFRDLATSVAPSLGSSVAVVGAVYIYHRYLSWLAFGRQQILLVEEILIGGLIGVVVLLRFDSELRGIVFSLMRKTPGLRAVWSQAD